MKKRRVSVLSGIYPPDSGGPATFAVSFSDFLTEKKLCSKVISLTDGRGISEIEFEKSLKLISRNTGLLRRTIFVTVEILGEFLKGSHLIANGFFVETYFASLLLNRTYTAKVPGDIVWERAYNSKLTHSDIRSFQSEKMNLKYRLFRVLFTRSLQRAKNVIVPSPLLYELCLSWGLPKDKVHLIYNSVDVDFYKPAEIPKFEYDCVVVNRLVKWKNVDQVLTACSNLDLSLLVVGDGPDMQRLKSLADALEGRFHFVGNASSSEIIAYLQSARIYILNSTADATAYSLLEARSCGLVAIANISTGASEVISHKKDGFLTESTDHQELERALTWVMSKEPSEISHMREAARLNTLSNFNRNINFERILDLAVAE